MRILATNSCGIGDFVLRQPLYAALTAAGHELTLTVRGNSTAFAKWVAPEARICSLPPSPVSGQLDMDGPDVNALVEQVCDPKPDLLLIPYFFWTRFEEKVAIALPDVPVMRSSGICLGSGARTLPPESRRETVVPVPPGIPEMKKIELLGSVVLGKPVNWREVILTPQESDLTSARATLKTLGLGDRPYLVVCAGPSIDRFRGWQQDKWAEVLLWAAGHYGLPMLFIGAHREHETTETIRGAMGDSETYTVCDRGLHMGGIAGLIALSSGYIGRDTGPMHVAAALDKPVIAIFSGNYWPRFIPTTRTGIAITATVHCIGCVGRCEFPEPYCINIVTPRALIDAARHVRLDGNGGLKVHRLDPAEVAPPDVVRRLEEHRLANPRMGWEKYLWPTIARYAAGNPVFRDRLLEDPQGALLEWGVELPPGRKVKVMADTSDKKHQVLPVAPVSTAAM